jgi:hypothetical protein
MDKNGVHAAKGEVEMEGGMSNKGTGLFQTCMERPYNATTDEVLSYYQVGRGRRGGTKWSETGRKRSMSQRWCNRIYAASYVACSVRSTIVFRFLSS